MCNSIIDMQFDRGLILSDITTSDTKPQPIKLTKEEWERARGKFIYTSQKKNTNWQ